MCNLKNVKRCPLTSVTLRIANTTHINTEAGDYMAQLVAEHARRVADLLQVFMAKGLVQRDGDTVVVRTIVVPPDELTKEWNELVSLVQELVRRRKCAQKDRALSSNKYPAYRVDLPCLNALLLEAEAAKVAEVVWDVDKTCEQLWSWYKGLPSFEEKVELVCAPT